MTDRALTRPPGIGGLFVRAGLAIVPGIDRLPFVGPAGEEVPGEALTLDDVAIDRDRLAAYDRVCGFDLSDSLPTTYPHLLAFPMTLALMTAPGFPVRAIGLVHVANTIVSHRPIDAGERLSLRVWATPLRPHPRGRQFDVRTEARVGSELVWEETSTNLARGEGDGSPRAEDRSGAESLPVTARWRLPSDLGRRYGSVSGDVNPIHVHPLTAKLFGFPSAIAHGMWTAARCLAQLRPEVPGASTMEVAFRRPILLPATVRFAERREGDRIAFGVRGHDRDDGARPTLHLSGTIAPA